MHPCAACNKPLPRIHLRRTSREGRTERVCGRACFGAPTYRPPFVARVIQGALRAIKSLWRNAS